jgi:hypothetical protein
VNPSALFAHYTTFLRGDQDEFFDAKREGLIHKNLLEMRSNF